MVGSITGPQALALSHLSGEAPPGEAGESRRYGTACYALRGEMLKVECESCKAPYQIDERRVPPTGLKMRCPKCGHSFLVTNPNAPAAPARPGAPPGPPRAPKPTMVGIGMGETAPPPPPPAAPAGPPKAPPPVSAAAKRTMMGVAAPVPMAPPAPPPPPQAARQPVAPPPSAPPQSPGLPSDFPAALRGMDESDLPVVSAGLPVVSAGLPAVRGGPPPMASAK